jgi:glycosyltransferase involved in cell wall biosynthesis
VAELHAGLFKKPMKIAQIVYFSGQCAAGHFGIGHAVHNASEELVKMGHEVTVFAPHCVGLKKHIHHYKVKALRPLFRFGHIFFAPQIWFYLKNFDIVHVHYPLWGMLEILAFYKFLHPKKCRFIIGYDVDVISAGFNKKLLKWQYRKILPKIMRQVDKIIVSSAEYVASSDVFGRYYFNNKKLFAEIPFGVPDKFVPAPKNEALLAKHGLTRGNIVLLFVGILDRQRYFKGVMYLIDALKYLDEKVRLLIVGDGDMRRFYQAKAEEKGLGKRVTFVGYVLDDALLDYYNLADIFVLASINRCEAFSAPLLEAMACAKPLVVSNLKGVRSVVNPGINGMLVEPKNSADIANKIKFLVERPQLMVDMGRRAVDIVGRNYRWPLIVKKLEAVYKRVLKKES